MGQRPSERTSIRTVRSHHLVQALAGRVSCNRRTMGASSWPRLRSALPVRRIPIPPRVFEHGVHMQTSPSPLIRTNQQSTDHQPPRQPKYLQVGTHIYYHHYTTTTVRRTPPTYTHTFTHRSSIMRHTPHPHHMVPLSKKIHGVDTWGAVTIKRPRCGLSPLKVTPTFIVCPGVNFSVRLSTVKFALSTW